MIEVGPVPMRVADLVVRACGDHQLSLVLLVVREPFAWAMEEEREAALQSARDIGMGALPRAPFRKSADPRQVVPIGDFLDQQVGKRCRRLADGESRMAAPFDEHDTAAGAAERERRQ